MATLAPREGQWDLKDESVMLQRPKCNYFNDPHLIKTQVYSP